MTTAPTPEEVHGLAARLEHCVAKWGKQNALSLEAYSAVKMMRRLQADNERLRGDYALRGAQIQRMAALIDELEARKPLPLSYRASAMTSSVDGGATVSLHFNDMAEAEAWFVAITDQHDACLVDKSPNLQGRGTRKPLPPDALADVCEAWLQAGGASNIVDAFEAGYRAAEGITGGSS